MQLDGVRRHMRIIKRLAAATPNPQAPEYENSALFFFERNEEIWGRRRSEVFLQESARYLDAFQASLPELEDLRSAAEALHVLTLRGHSPKINGRNIPEQARALAAYNRVPRLLLPRFPDYKKQLAPFVSIRTFHEHYPIGLGMDGQEITSEPPDFPMFASETLDRLLNTILVPIMTHKKHSSLTTTGGALSIPFIKECLPEIEQLYKVEVQAKVSAAEADPQASSSGASAEAAGTATVIVTPGEGARLEREWEKQELDIIETMAEELLRKNVVILRHDERELLTKLTNQPCMSDGSMRMWVFRRQCGKKQRGRK